VHSLYLSIAARVCRKGSHSCYSMNSACYTTMLCYAMLPAGGGLDKDDCRCIREMFPALQHLAIFDCDLEVETKDAHHALQLGQAIGDTRVRILELRNLYGFSGEMDLGEGLSLSPAAQEGLLDLRLDPLPLPHSGDRIPLFGRRLGSLSQLRHLHLYDTSDIRMGCTDIHLMLPQLVHLKTLSMPFLYVDFDHTNTEGLELASASLEDLTLTKVSWLAPDRWGWG